MKLTIEHLAPYAPHNLMLLIDENIPCLLEGFDLLTKDSAIAERINYKIQDVKPILRPLSDLAQEITHNGETFVPIEALAKIWANGHFNPGIRETEWYCKEFYAEGEAYVSKFYHKHPWVEINNQYQYVQKLLSWHFDIFDLIDKGLAIDINTLKL